MGTALLATKLHIPRVRRELVARPLLVERLEAGFRRKLSLVCAPAGFGKTTLLGEYAAQCQRPVSWLSLDEGDNDPTRFWTYIIAALQTIATDVGETHLAMLHSSQAPLTEAFLTGLINEITERPTSCVLILDDLHVITEPQIHDGLAFLLENLPPTLHLILCSRADPPWPLARLRARGEMTELRAEDLRFTLQETTTFLNQALGLALSAEDVAALDTRTEGWIAGLQMAAISMRGRQRMQPLHDLSTFIEALTGSHRFILDYLVEEVLDQQPTDIREFLLKTSILERMTAGLCDAVLGRSDSQRILRHLVRSNMFIVPLDDERRWYRYHNLFADLLRSRLDQISPDQIAFIHRRTSEWYEQRGWLAPAVHHSLAADDIQRVARLVEGNAIALVQHRELRTLIRWLGALPDEAFSSHPWLCIALAWVLSYAGHVDGIEPLMQRAEQGLEGVRDPAQVRSILGRIAHLRGYVADLEGDSPRSLRLGREALEHLTEDDASLRAYALSAVGISLRKLGKLSDAAEAFAEAVALSRAAGDSHVAVMVLCRLATLQIWQGQLHQAALTCRNALSVMREHAQGEGYRLPTAGYVHIQMSRVLSEWNDLDAAQRHAQQGIDLCQRWGQADILEFGYYHLAKTLYRRQDLARLREISQAFSQIIGALPTWFAPGATEVELMVRLASGDLESAFRLAQERGMDTLACLTLDQYFHLFTYVRLLIALGRLDEALELVSQMLDMAEATGAMGYVIELSVLKAVASQAKGDCDQASTALQRALSLAKPEGHVRLFIDEGAAMEKLLTEFLEKRRPGQQAATPGSTVEYATHLLAALEAEARQARRPAPSAGPLPPLADPLTDRELEVLRLLATELSTAAIADHLVISLHTLRTHTKRIYGKLDVHSRIQAVARAHDLGMM
jgi:LuxR family maltose regulon positive regulatory protein